MKYHNKQKAEAVPSKFKGEQVCSWKIYIASQETQPTGKGHADTFDSLDEGRTRSGKV